MCDMDARAGVRVGFDATNHEIETAPRGFYGLESRMMQQTTHAFAEGGIALGIGGLRGCSMGAGQLAEVVLEGVAAAGDLFQQAGLSKQFADVGLGRGALRRL